VMLVPSRLRLALPALLLGAGPSPDPPSSAKSVLFIRHGESVANAAGPLGADIYDAPLTNLGRMQAAAWAREAPHWGVEQIFCSPLVRSIETAATIFGEDDQAPLTVTPSCREYRWEHAENRGRLAAGLVSGTANGQPGEPVLWPKPGDFARSKEDWEFRYVTEPTELWDPMAEAAAASTPQVLELRWRRTLSRLPRQIAASSASRIAVVCHYGVMEALCGVTAGNCGAL